MATKTPHTCHRCGGSGQYKRFGECFTCKGSGKTTVRARAGTKPARRQLPRCNGGPPHARCTKLHSHGGACAPKMARVADGYREAELARLSECDRRLARETERLRLAGAEAGDPTLSGVCTGATYTPHREPCTKPHGHHGPCTPRAAKATGWDTKQRQALAALVDIFED